MTDSLGDILKQYKQAPREPEDFKIIRKYIQDRFSVTPRLSLHNRSIYIMVPNAAIAANLRFELYDLSQKLETKLRLVIKLDR